MVVPVVVHPAAVLVPVAERERVRVERAEDHVPVRGVRGEVRQGHVLERPGPPPFPAQGEVGPAAGTPNDTSLIEAIEMERELLSPLAESAHRIDTSNVRTNTLRSWIKELIRSILADYEAKVTDLIIQAKAQKLVRPDLNEQDAAVMFIGIIQGLVIRVSVIETRKSLISEGKLVFPIFLHGIGATRASDAGPN